MFGNRRIAQKAKSVLFWTPVLRNQFTQPVARRNFVVPLEFLLSAHQSLGVLKKKTFLHKRSGARIPPFSRCHRTGRRGFPRNRQLVGIAVKVENPPRNSFVRRIRFLAKIFPCSRGRMDFPIESRRCSKFFSPSSDRR